MALLKKYFSGSLIVAFLGILLGASVGFYDGGTWEAGLVAGFLTLVLAVLEISLSFDNAVVNASVLKTMTPVWRHRFITWGMLIAVFGMRLIFPLVIVGIVAQVSPWTALVIAATQPDRYAQIMASSQILVTGFGATFLLMVCLKYFFDSQKETHWIQWIERPLSRLGKIESLEIALTFLLIFGLSHLLDAHKDRYHFVIAGVLGVIVYILVDGVSQWLRLSNAAQQDIHKASAAMFVYLEVLDASFSFDGVIGAFALTHNLFVIAIGLGVGAMFVRSLTIMLVEKETLGEFVYLEHGAFYAIGALALFMVLDLFIHIPEILTGFIGALLIGLSLFSSIKHRRSARA